MPFYAVAKGYDTGVFLNWNECNNSVKGFKGAVYKKFDTKQDAENFISSINNTKIKSNNDVDYFVYTDGACSNNGKSNSLAGIGIFFGIDDYRNVSEKIKGKQTNNLPPGVRSSVNKFLSKPPKNKTAVKWLKHARELL